jgi:photosystem II stability/assembly factor-like uncharacterized protein
MDGRQIWSIAVHPSDSDVIFAGTKPPGVFRSIDGGKRWEQLSIGIAEQCFAGAPKVTNIVFDPRDHRAVWVGVEIDGVFCSRDGGDTWLRLPPLGDSMLNQDVHGLAVSLGRPTKILATTPDGIWTSTNEGESWTLHGFPRFYEAIQRSTDGGKTWAAAPLPVEPNSTIYWFATHPTDPNVIVANSLNGYVYTSGDGGDSWTKVKQEFGEVRALAWVPN